MFILFTLPIIYAINPKLFGLSIVVLSVVRFFQLIESGIFWSQLKKKSVSGANFETKNLLHEVYKPFSSSNSLFAALPYIFMFMAGLYITENGISMMGFVSYIILFSGLQILCNTFMPIAVNNGNGNGNQTVWWIRFFAILMIGLGWVLFTNAAGNKVSSIKALTTTNSEAKTVNQTPAKNFTNNQESNRAVDQIANKPQATKLKMGCRLLYTMASYRAAIAQCMDEAKGGNADSAEIVSLMYEHGQGVMQDQSESTIWADIAKRNRIEFNLKKGNASSTSEHWSNCKNENVAFNDKITECEKAANMGHIEAQMYLASLYASHAYGDIKDSDQEALLWYTKAARQGNAEAQFEVAERILNTNDHERQGWYLKSANQGYIKAQFKLAELYYQNPSERRHAKGWYEKATSSDAAAKLDKNYILTFFDMMPGGSVTDNYAVVESQYKLGLIHQAGLGTIQSFTDSLAWFQSAANHGHTKAQIALGQQYQLGLGVPKDNVIAHMWFNIAAANNLSDVTDASNKRTLVEMHMTAEQITLAQANAKNWLKSYMR